MSPEVVAVEAYPPLRAYLRLVLDGAGYRVTLPPTHDKALSYLRVCQHPVVAVIANTSPDNRHEATFFDTVLASGHLMTRHRYVLLTTTPEHLPPALHGHLAVLGAPILTKPVERTRLLAAVRDAAYAL